MSKGSSRRLQDKEAKQFPRCVVLYTVKINVAESPPREKKKESFCVSRKRVYVYGFHFISI